MYRWIWNKLPGRKALKTLQVAALLALLIALLFGVVFPQLDLIFIAPPTLG